MEEKTKQQIRARMIVEIVGFPESHVNYTLNLLAEKFGEGNKHIKVLSKNTNQAIKVDFTQKKLKSEKTDEKPTQEFFSGFCEFEVEADSLDSFFGLVLDYMPSSIEIISPESITEKSEELSALMNDLAARLHQYDSIAKMDKARIAVLEKELEKFLKNSEGK